MKKQELAELVLTKEQLKDIDYALPQDFVNAMSDFYDIDVRSMYVWNYKNTSLGLPLDLGKLFVEKYADIFNLIKSSKIVLQNAKDRQDAYPFDETELTDDNMIDEFKRLADCLKPCENG